MRKVVAVLASGGILVGILSGPAQAEVAHSEPAPKVAKWQDCPTSADLNAFVTGRSAGRSAYSLCVEAASKAPTPEAAGAVVSAFWALGSLIACPPPGPGDRDGSEYDPGSLVSRSYAYSGLKGFQPGGKSMSSAQILGMSGFKAPKFLTKTRQVAPGDILGYRWGSKAMPSYFVDLSIGGGAVISARGMCGESVRVMNVAKTSAKGPFSVATLRVLPAKAR